MEKGQVILLNGASSSGKTTLSRRLLEKLPAQYHYLSVDTFMQMEPEWYLEQAFNHTIAYLSDRGIHTIVDTVFLDTPPGKALFAECLEQLQDHPVLLVRVDCPLEELERREQARGDRGPGQARWQFEHIHGHGVYDVTINTFDMTLEECAEAILARVERPDEWTAFKTLHNHLVFERYHSSEITISTEYSRREEDFLGCRLTPENEKQINLVARNEDGHLIGGVLAVSKGKCLRMKGLWIDPAYDGQSVDARLLDAAEETARQAGCSIAKTIVYANSDAVNPERVSAQEMEFFKQQGYQVCGMLDEYEDGIAGWQLKKRLDGAV